jgi:hypothetical protein
MMYRIDEYNEDSTSGIATALAALALAMEEKGALRKNDYSDALRRLWDDMPEDEAVGESGAIIQKVLDVLAVADRRAPAGNGAGEATELEAVMLRVA